MHEEFNRRLLREARAGNRFIVVIDEAQNLDASVLETVRLLSDFETPQAKLMHIILAGQPELADKLASPGLAQLRQRVSIVHGLEPLPAWEINNYIEHRLRIAGYEGPPLFTPDAYQAIAKFTEGIPRNVNNFCFHALSLACALRKKVVDVDVVKEVVSDLDISRLVSEPAFEPAAVPVPHSFHPLSSAAPSFAAPAPAPVPPRNQQAALSPDEAKAYMQQVALKLKSWQDSLDKTVSGVRRDAPAQTRKDGERS